MAKRKNANGRPRGPQELLASRDQVIADFYRDEGFHEDEIAELLVWVQEDPGWGPEHWTDVAERYATHKAQLLWQRRRGNPAARPAVQPAPRHSAIKAKPKRLKVNDRMAVELLKNPESRDWSAQQWADHLGCAKSTASTAPQFRALLAMRIGAHLERQVTRARMRR